MPIIGWFYFYLDQDLKTIIILFRNPSEVVRKKVLFIWNNFYATVCDLKGQRRPTWTFCREAVLKKFAKFSPYTTCLHPAVLLKRDLYRYFAVNFTKIFETFRFFFTEHLRWLLLTLQIADNPTKLFQLNRTLPFISIHFNLEIVKYSEYSRQ